MDEKSYILKINNYINNNRKLKKIIIGIERYSPMPIIATFYSVMFFLFITKDTRYVPYILITSFTYIFVTVFRSFINAPRPFEQMNFKPIINHSKGKSFPSRHASSASVITIAVFWVNQPFGIIVGVFTLIVAITRILCGVHYLKDILAGIIVGGLFGYVGFYVLI